MDELFDMVACLIFLIFLIVAAGAAIAGVVFAFKLAWWMVGSAWGSMA